MACTHLCRGGRIDRLIALARSFVAVNKTPPVMLRTKKLVSYLHHQFSNSAQCPRDRSRPEVGHGPSQTCPMSVSHDVPLPSLAPLSPPPPFFVSVLDPPGFFFAPGPGPGPALTHRGLPRAQQPNKTVGGTRRDLPLSHVGEPAAAAAARRAVLVPDVHVFGVPVQVGGGEAPNA